MLEAETAVAEPSHLRLVAPEEFSPARELNAKWVRHLTRRVKISPWTWTRASGIGDPCERRMYYRRTEGNRENPYSYELQAIFDLGNYLETYAVRKLEAMGYDVLQRGKDWADPDLEMTGHVDALIGHETWPFDVVAEVKGLNEFTAGTIETIADIRDSASTWVRKYYDQLQTYLWLEKKSLGMFALLGKSSGGFTFVDCPRDDERIAQLLEKAKRVRDAVKMREPPARTLLSEECQRCGFKHLCCPDQVYGEAPVIIEKPPQELVTLLSRRDELADSNKEYQRVDKRVKAMLPDAAHVLVADFEVEAKQNSAGTWTRKITRLGGEKK